jgi:putative chitinase
MTDIDWRRVQQRLGVAADGVAGPGTFAAVLRHMGARDLAPVLGKACALVLPASGIVTRLRLAHWLGQNAHESGGFARLVENLNYSKPERLMAVWPSRFPTRESALPFVNNPEALASKVYGGRMGNVSPGYGWRYRGRGLKMITGFTNYMQLQQLTGIPIVGTPDLAADPEIAVRLSVGYWNRTGCDIWADRDDVGALSNLINRGDPRARQSAIGLADRQARTLRAKALLA